MAKRTTPFRTGELTITDAGAELVVPYGSSSWKIMNDGLSTVFIGVDISPNLLVTAGAPVGLGQIPLASGETISNDFNPKKRTTKFALKTAAGNSTSIRFVFA